MFLPALWLSGSTGMAGWAPMSVHRGWRSQAIDVVVDSAADAGISLTVAGRDVRLGPGGAAVETIDLDGADPVLRVRSGAERLEVAGAVRVVPAARLRLVSAQSRDSIHKS